MRTLEYQAIEQDDGIRLELILKRRLGLSARQIRQLKFLSDGITVNGNRERIVYSVRSGDRIRVTFSEQNRNLQELPFLEKPLHILYEDEDLLVVDKKAGEVCHPAHGHYQDTLANQAAAYLAGHGAEKAPVRCIGRLDKDTSGTLLFAKNRLAAERLARQKEDGVFRKEYLALVNGLFSSSERSGEICLPIAPLPGSLRKMQVAANGERALTRYEG